MPSLNGTAKAFRALHKPGSPVVLANVYDAITANAIASLPGCHALATASYAVAQAAGLEDNDLDMETNLRVAKVIAAVAKKYNKPLTVDFQDGYGDRLDEGVKRLIEIGVVGINLEDVEDRQTSKLYGIDGAAARVKVAVQTAAANGVPDFLVNARVDALVQGGTIDEAIKRGKAYLAAGAANVFVWGGSHRGGITRDEVKQLSDAFGGRLNVSLRLASGNATVQDVAEMGVSRCSIGPALQFVSAEAAKSAVAGYLSA